MSMDTDPVCGTLYLCATPIGNLGDITQRVLDTLSSVDLIAAEDTRNTLKLLNHFGIRRPLTSYHEHNKYEKADELIAQLRAGKNIACVTDAGTPAISDPGEVLCARCMEAGIHVTSLPGACALITALTLSGMPARRFCFEGFLPPDRKERKRVLEQLAAEERTIILYEAPHHLRATLSLLLSVLGSRRAALGRELTKRFEEFERGTLDELCALYAKKEPRGEYVIVVEGAGSAPPVKEAPRLSPEACYRKFLSEGMEKKEAMRQAAKALGISRRAVYQAVLDLQKKKG